MVNPVSYILRKLGYEAAEEVVERGSREAAQAALAESTERVGRQLAEEFAGRNANDLVSTVLETSPTGEVIERIALQDTAAAFVRRQIANGESAESVAQALRRTLGDGAEEAIGEGIERSTRQIAGEAISEIGQQAQETFVTHQLTRLTREFANNPDRLPQPEQLQSMLARAAQEAAEAAGNPHAAQALTEGADALATRTMKDFIETGMTKAAREARHAAGTAAETAKSSKLAGWLRYGAAASAVVGIGTGAVGVAWTMMPEGGKDLVPDGVRQRLGLDNGSTTETPAPGSPEAGETTQNEGPGWFGSLLSSLPIVGGLFGGIATRFNGAVNYMASGFGALTLLGGGAWLAKEASESADREANAPRDTSNHRVEVVSQHQNTAPISPEVAAQATASVASEMTEAVVEHSENELHLDGVAQAEETGRVATQTTPGAEKTTENQIG